MTRGVQRRGEMHAEIQRARPVGGQAHHQRLIRRAHEGLPGEADALRLVFHPVNASGHIQRPAIAADVSLMLHGQADVAQRQIHLRP